MCEMRRQCIGDGWGNHHHPKRIIQHSGWVSGDSVPFTNLAFTLMSWTECTHFVAQCWVCGWEHEAVTDTFSFSGHVPLQPIVSCFSPRTYISLFNLAVYFWSCCLSCFAHHIGTLASDLSNAFFFVLCISWNQIRNEIYGGQPFLNFAWRTTVY